MVNLNYKKTIRKFEKEYDKKSTRKLSDMIGFFRDEKAVQEILKKKDPVLYNVYIKEFSPIDMGLTVINPGTVKKEFYFTKGHIHGKQTPEFYILLEGKGKLLIQKTNSKPNPIKLNKGEIELIPKGYAHRLVNIGTQKLKVLTIYHEDSKPNYKVKFKKRFFKK